MAPRTPLEKIPVEFRYQFRCAEVTCRGHRIMCTDWEMGQSYRRWRDQYGERWEAMFRQRYERDMIEKNDTHFYVGNIHQHPDNWLIVGPRRRWPPSRDRWFESISLQRGVRCERLVPPAGACPRVESGAGSRAGQRPDPGEAGSAQLMGRGAVPYPRTLPRAGPRRRGRRVQRRLGNALPQYGSAMVGGLTPRAIARAAEEAPERWRKRSARR
jgi:hypothetical protein